MQISLVSKEVIITCGIFLLTFLLGAHLLDSLNLGKTDAVTTAAVAINPLDGDHSQGAVIKKGKRGIFGFLSDEDKDDKKGLRELEKKKKDNLITGNVIGLAVSAVREDISLAPSADDIESTYTIKPDFVVQQPGSFSTFTDTFVQQRTRFVQDIQTCLADRDETFLSLCIQETLQKDAFTGWMAEKKCETSEEQVFYDFVEHLRNCFVFDRCLCQFSMDYERGYGAASYDFTLSEGNDGMYVQSLKGSLAVVFPPISYTSSLTPTEDQQPLLYHVQYADQAVTDASFGPGLVSDASVYLLKEGQTVQFLTPAAYAEHEDKYSSCSIAAKTTYKFCYPVTDTLHVFAVDFG